MKRGSKGAFAAGGILLLVIALMLVGYYAGFSSARSAVRIGYVGHEGWGSWSASYAQLDGTMKKIIHPDGNTLHISVRTESGSISIEVKDRDGNCLFNEENIGTYELKLDVPGQVEVRIKAEKHKGGFDIH